MSLVLNQPKWQKFLSLKRQRNITNEPILNGDRKESNIPQIDASEKQSTVLETPPTKKRKRSEEEIALRKAKKLKSKKKDSQALVAEMQSSQTDPIGGRAGLEHWTDSVRPHEA